MARDLALEAAIIAHPDDNASYSVYADWLESQGDPRGRLIAMKLAALPSDGKMQAVIKAYMTRHEDTLLGDVGKRVGVLWRNGFFERVSIDRSYAKEPIAGLLEALLAHPSAALLRSLSLRDAFAEDTAQPSIDVLARVAPRALRSLELCFDRDVGSLAALHGLALEAITVGHVLAGRGDFVARRAAVSPDCVRSIVAAPWQLRELELDFEGGTATIEDLLPLFTHRIPLDSLVIKHVRTGGSQFARELIHALVDSPFARRLKKLWLWGMVIERADYNHLVDHRARFGKLADVQLPSRTFAAKLRQ